MRPGSPGDGCVGRGLRSLAVVLFGAGAAAVESTHWQPVEGTLMTRWAASVQPDNVWPEYPRPQMVRSEWLNLNGLWQYAIRPGGELRSAYAEPQPPTSWDGAILVPFCAESALSGVGKAVGETNRLWYGRAFEVPRNWDGRRVLLQVGAVDWEAVVWVNGIRVGTHRGGYDPFGFDITDALSEDRQQEVVVAVWDPTDSGHQPRGKQVREPEGIWYTAVTGIWQTVWLEPVDPVHVEWVRTSPDVDAGAVSVETAVRTERGGLSIHVDVRAGEDTVQEATVLLPGPDVPGTGLTVPRVSLALPEPRLWSPDDPFLYGLRVRVSHGGRETDRIDATFGMRKISVEQDEGGTARLMLNNHPLFQYGLLDQGWWPDGLYTAPNDEALRHDLEIAKSLGFNMVRKHVKVEPARWYHHCDRLGLLVWQDMPNADRDSGRDTTAAAPRLESDLAFRRELEAMVDLAGSFACVTMWVPFNEGWGQFETEQITTWLQMRDPTRLVNSASGWTDHGVGQVLDIHRYPGPGIPPLERDRAAVLGEFGGIGLAVQGHLWWDKRNWGYRTVETREELAATYTELVEQLRGLAQSGLSAAVYTQTTDVEGEVNGIMTYDRSVVKLPDEVAEVHRRLHLPTPRVRILLPTSETTTEAWQYTCERPAEDWAQPEFDESTWRTGAGGFGTEDTPNAVIGTVWDSTDIWLRRTFQVYSLPQGAPTLRLYHDEDAEVYINGILALRVTGYVTSYVQRPVRREAAAALRIGLNTVAVHCAQTRGGQCIDVGILDVVDPHVETGENR